MRGRFDSRADDPLFFGAARRATVPRWVPMDVRLEWGHGGSPSNGEASATPRMIEDPCPHHMRYCSLLVQALRNADDGRYSAWRSRSFGWPLLDEGHFHIVPRHQAWLILRPVGWEPGRTDCGDRRMGPQHHLQRDKGRRRRHPEET